MLERVNFEDDVVIITGGAGGIGEQTVREFAKEGADVVIADIDVERGETIEKDVTEEFDGNVRFVKTDVSDYEACQICVEAARDEFGKVTILVNGATSRRFPRSERFQSFLNQTQDHWDALLDVTLKGAVNMTHCALPDIIESGNGSVINISSISRLGTSNLSKFISANTMYATVKFALVGFTNELANEVGPDGVRVNTIAPGIIRTAETEDAIAEYGEQMVEKIPLRRWGEPLDCADLICFLASDAASWITGQTVSVNGGYLS